MGKRVGKPFNDDNNDNKKKASWAAVDTHTHIQVLLGKKIRLMHSICMNSTYQYQFSKIPIRQFRY